VDPSGKPDSDTDAEFRRVALPTAGGDPAEARAIRRRLGESGDAAVAGRAPRLAAALDRALGDLDDAVTTAQRAAESSARTSARPLSPDRCGRCATGSPAPSATTTTRAAVRASRMVGING
jgi:hypothetical protein